VKVTVDMVFSHALRAFPEKIGQAKKQNVVFEGNHYFSNSLIIDEEIHQSNTSILSRA
jgi:hypothetical protein